MERATLPSSLSAHPAAPADQVMADLFPRVPTSFPFSFRCLLFCSSSFLFSFLALSLGSTPSCLSLLAPSVVMSTEAPSIPCNKASQSTSTPPHHHHLLLLSLHPFTRHTTSAPAQAQESYTFMRSPTPLPLCPPQQARKRNPTRESSPLLVQKSFGLSDVRLF